MSKLYTTIFCTVLISMTAWAQSGNWAAQPYASDHLVWGDMDFDHPERSFSPGVGFKLHYGLADNLWIYGDVGYSTAYGGSSWRYYDSQFMSGMLGLQYDVWRALFPDAAFSLSADVGIGWSLILSRGYDGATGELLADVPYEGPYSNAIPFGTGFQAAFPVHDQVDITVGYRNLWFVDNDWIDGFRNGDHNDHVGQITLGLKFALNGRSGMVKMEPSEVEELQTRARNAERERDEALADLESSRNRYETQIEDINNILAVMRNSIDSLNEKVTILKSTAPGSNEYQVMNGQGGEVSTPSPEGAQWRIVIGSFPSAERAREFVNERVVEGGNYEVVYITDLNTYRVVYDSYPTLEAARKEITNVRQTISNAWIIKF